MIKVNLKELPFEEGLHVQALLDKLKATGRYDVVINASTVVRINNVFIPRTEYLTTYIQDGDSLLVIPHLSGG